MTKLTVYIQDAFRPETILMRQNIVQPTRNILFFRTHAALRTCRLWVVKEGPSDGFFFSQDDF